jgi:hypothetical protein
LRLPLLGVDSEWEEEKAKVNSYEKEEDVNKSSKRVSKKKKRKSEGKKGGRKDLEIRITRSKTQCGEEAVPTGLLRCMISITSTLIFV